MCGSWMALRYDDRGSNFSKPYYNGKSGGGGGGNSGSKDRSGWNHSGDGNGGGGNGGGGGSRYSGNDHRESTSSNVNDNNRRYDRRDYASAGRSHENWADDRSNGDSDKAQMKQVGDWTEQFSSGGKKYYYNCRTEISQWEKPTEWVAWEKRQGQDQNRKRRPDRSTTDDQISPSHSSGGRPSSSRDHNQNSSQHHRKVVGHQNESGASHDNYGGDRNYNNQSRRNYSSNNNTSGGAGPSRSNDSSRGGAGIGGNGGGGGGGRSKHDAKSNIQLSTSRSAYDGGQQSSKFDQHGHANSSSIDRGGTSDHRDKSKRPSTRDADHEDSNALRERSPKRSRIAEHGDSEKNGQDNRNRDQAPPAAVEPMECDDDDFAANVQVDMERLPHLLVEIAQKNGIDLSDPDALEKIKRHLKSALCHELKTTAAPSKNGETNNFAVVSEDEEEPSKAEEQPQQQAFAGAQDKCMIDGEDGKAQSENAAGSVTQASLASLFNEKLVAHIRGWSAEHFDVQATNLSNAAFRTTLQVANIAAELKCARSLVRTAEIRSTLLEQRIAYLRQQYHELETMSKPNAAVPVSATLGGST